MASADTINKSSEANRKLFLGILFLEIFILIQIISISDLQLLVSDSAIKLPVFNIEIPLYLFSRFAPFLIVAFHLYQLNSLYYHTKLYTKFDDKLRADGDLDNVLNFFWNQKFTINNRLYEALFAFFVDSIVYILPFFILFVHFELFFKLGDLSTTYWNSGALLLDALLLFIFHRRIKDPEKEEQTDSEVKEEGTPKDNSSELEKERDENGYTTKGITEESETENDEPKEDKKVSFIDRLEAVGKGIGRQFQFIYRGRVGDNSDTARLFRKFTIRHNPITSLIVTFVRGLIWAYKNRKDRKLIVRSMAAFLSKRGVEISTYVVLFVTCWHFLALYNQCSKLKSTLMGDRGYSLGQEQIIKQVPKEFELEEYPWTDTLPRAKFPKGVYGYSLAKRDIYHSDFSNSGMVRFGIKYSKISNSNFKSVDARRMDLTGSSLDSCDFEKSNLGFSNLTQTKLNFCNFWGANFYKSFGLNAKVYRCDFVYSFFDRSEIKNSRFTRSNFAFSSHQFNRLDSSRFIGCNLDNVHMVSTYLNNGLLLGCNSQEGYYMAISIKNLKLQGNYFLGCHFEGCIFDSVKSINNDYKGCFFENGTTFTRSDFTSSNFYSSHFISFNAERDTFTNSNFRKATFNDGMTFTNCIFDYCKMDSVMIDPRTEFKNCSFYGARIDSSEINNVLFDSCDFGGAIFGSKARFNNCEFRNSNFTLTGDSSFIQYLRASGNIVK